MIVVVVRVAIVRDRRITGLSERVVADLVAEVGPVWQEQRERRLRDGPRRRDIGAGGKYRLVFVDRLLAMLVHLRHGTTHDVLACWFGVNRSTITRAIIEIRPLLAERALTQPVPIAGWSTNHWGDSTSSVTASGTTNRCSARP